MNATKRTAVEDAEALLAYGVDASPSHVLLRRLVDECKRNASRADTAMRRVVELEAEVVRLEEARRS